MMQTVLQILLLVLMLGIVPLLVGGIFVRPAGEAFKLPGEGPELSGACFGLSGEGLSLPLRWVGGQMVLWGGFQVICVPVILKEAPFHLVVKLFLVYTGILLLLSLGLGIRQWKKGKRQAFRGFRGERSVREMVLPVIFWGLLLFQLVQAVRLTYGDGDDAYYVAISTATESSDRMYNTLAYTGLTTTTDLRHGLAPFPVWIAFLAEISGMPVVMTAHVAVAVTMIAMGYAALSLIGGQLFGKREQRWLFLIFAELLVVFGGYSLYTAENFMMARSRQGKAALSSLVIPFLLFLLLYLFRRLDAGEGVPRGFYVLTTAAVAAGSLCSTLGALLCCMLAGGAWVLGLCLYRNRRRLFPLIFCCLPGIVYALLYMIFKKVG